ncbi:MAG: BamA/TamA family outer membrane protein [Bacteroidota bacterium]|nr:BamA/TamA family outer membrane protein [Bacteroidota bacterium]MDP4189998.1 BamA/TamA family outer membrane protein [Bacteroidota bacterium]
MILFLPMLCFAQTIEKVNVHGNSIFDTEDYLKWINLSPGEKIFPGIKDSLKKRVELNLSERGYFFSKAETILKPNPNDSKKTSLIELNISEGAPTYINRIVLLGKNLSDSLKLLSLFNYQIGKVFNKSALEENFSLILDNFEEKGFPFAKVIISSFDFYIDSVSGKNLTTIYLKIDPGKLTKIDRIELKGNSKTNDYVILREVRMNNGIYYSQKLIDQIPKKLDKLRFFDPVQTPSFYFNSRDEGVLLIEVKEKETNNFDGIIGYLPADKQNNESGYLTGLVNVTLRNMFGTGRAATIKWQQIDRLSQELELKYLEPWVFGYPFNVNLGLFQQKQDSSYVHRRLEGSVEFLASENVSASVVLASESVIPTVSETSTFTVYNSTITTSGLNLKIDTRDDYYAPNDGIYMLNSYSFSRKKINGPSQYFTSSTKLSTSLQRFSLDFGIFRKVFTSQVFALSLHARELRGDQLEVSDLYRLGGTNSLRGYRENQFLANRLLWSNLEFRQPFTRRSFGFIFFDSGYYLRDQDPEKNIERSSAIKLGYGLGLNLETGFGILSVSYALAKGDSFSQGKIHFGLVNEF